MKVKKRSGRLESVKLDKILKRIKFIANEEKEGYYGKLNINEIEIAKKVVDGLYDGVTTKELDQLAARTSASMGTKHYDYLQLAGRIEVSRLHKETPKTFSSFCSDMHELSIINDGFNEFVQEYSDEIDAMIDPDLDYKLDYFGFKTLERSYLLKDKDGFILERPCYMWMRTAIQVSDYDLNEIHTTYKLLADGYYTHATPTLFNSGTNNPQLSSCFLIDINDDSISGIFKTVSDCAQISKHAGGIGISINKIRSIGSGIAGTNGNSNGIVPMLRVFDATARYVDQGGNKRKGSFAVYLEPWHADIFEFLDLKKNHGKEEMRARDLFYGLWIPDLFMQRVHEDGMWTLFDPKRTKEANGEGKALYEIWGEGFNEAYVCLEKIGAGTRQIKARDLWNRIIESQIETGTPYILYKDHINKKSNQKNLGTIKSSNLCCEVTEYTSPEETAVCNLASISLPKFVKDNWIDIDKLVEVSRVVCRNLNNVIDRGFYPTKEAKYSNFKNRPIGIGVQGLADVFAQLKLPFTSEKAKELNRIIFEAIYYGAVTESIDLAAKYGVYDSFEGSPTSMGQLQFDLWEDGENKHPLCFKEQWMEIKSNLPTTGMRNSLLIAPMPTASTSQILGNNEAFEPFNSNIYSRRTLGGDFVIINKHLIKDLESLDIWDEEMIDEIIHERGSVQNIERIPDDLKEVYKTVWELKMKDIIDMAADRGRFVCQSQSMNIFFSNPNISNVTSSHFYAWELGLKTGCYYLRSKPATNPVSLVSKNKVHTKQIKEDPQVCNLDDQDCEACSS